MRGLNSVAAEVLEASAAGYAAAAVALLHPVEGTAPLGTDGVAWKSHLLQRVLELAAAVRVQQPELFAQRMAWLRRATLARGADDLELRRALMSLQAALSREMPEHLRPVVAPALELAIEAFDSVPVPESRVLDSAKPLDRIALRYLAACLEGNPRQAIAIVLTELERGVAPSIAYTQVLLPAEKEIGQLWHLGEVSIAEERLVSETTRELMALIVAKYAPHEPGRHTLIAAAVATNSHDIGLRAVADLFRLAGWRCLFLGANIPAMEIAKAADMFGVDLVVLNATLATQLEPLREAIDTIRQFAPARKVLVGGLALDCVPALWKDLGADGYAPTIETAVAAGTALVERLQ